MNSASPADKSVSPGGHALSSSSAHGQSAKPGGGGGGRMVVLMGIVAAACIAASFLVFGRTKAPPRVNAKIEDIARYVDAAGFTKLPFDRQEFYMKVLDQRRDDLRTAIRNKVLTEEEYRASIEYAWFGKQLTRMQRYIALPTATEKNEYLQKTARKTLEEKQAGPKQPTDAEELPKREETSEKTYPLTWPADVRTQWDDYRKAFKKAEKKVERDMIAESLRNPATQPAKAVPAKPKKGSKSPAPTSGKK